MEGGDVFFTELWTSDPSIVDGSHTWYSDGGVSRYNRLLYEEQVITIPDSVGPFFLAMDTSEDQINGRIHEEYSQHVALVDGAVDHRPIRNRTWRWIVWCRVV